ncbi:unnamed protein product [Chironomus riparius]|uniref:Uncharacterized protein n=1 Tax=Chironomus riparius TaxID=315576 RepID=A0A9N9RQG1_9DIPT|nr:unnamed protein product [Chironomus riparius]
MSGTELKNEDELEDLTKTSDDVEEKNNDHVKEPDNDINTRNCLDENKCDSSRHPKKQLKSPIRGACPASKSINSPQHDTSLDTDEQFQEQIDKPIVEASHEETIDLNVKSQNI